MSPLGPMTEHPIPYADGPMHDIVFWLVLAPNPLAPTMEREKSIVVPVAELGVRVWPQ